MLNRFIFPAPPTLSVSAGSTLGLQQVPQHTPDTDASRNRVELQEPNSNKNLPKAAKRRKRVSQPPAPNTSS